LGQDAVRRHRWHLGAHGRCSTSTVAVVGSVRHLPFGASRIQLRPLRDARIDSIPQWRTPFGVDGATGSRARAIGVRGHRRRYAGISSD
jgi:hypothetical protein